MELLARPGHAAADGAVRTPEPARRLVDGEALEVAEDDRQAEGLGKSTDLVLQRLELLAEEDRLLDRQAGGRGRRRRDPVVLALGSNGGPQPGGSGGAERDPVQPVAQLFGVADRPGF